VAHERGLPDAGLAGDERHATVTADDGCEAPVELLDEGRPLQERLPV
jgi:hypothetical protein